MNIGRKIIEAHTRAYHEGEPLSIEQIGELADKLHRAKLNESNGIGASPEFLSLLLDQNGYPNTGGHSIYGRICMMAKELQQARTELQHLKNNNRKDAA